MYLSELKLNGFKSFADNTRLRFDPGVTAVVGPNGCGKSNIADAVRWVLGEQSAKALRGGRMQDVIFEGTDRRKPVNLCEVSITLTDCERELGRDFHEVEIARVANRDGGSSYYLNGKACRLKDIQRLFMDTGVGRASYSIMAQGQIDQILSSKPEERRLVFEEAAGISKYKSQRKEAMNKLAHVEANLQRVSDIVAEVSRQIGSLRRQASKAIRYKKLSHRLRHLDLASHACQHERLKEELGSMDQGAASLQETLQGQESELQRHEGRLTVAKEERQRLTQDVQGAQQSVFDLKSAKEQAENRRHMAQIKISSLEERIEQAREEVASCEKQITELGSRVDERSQDKQLHLDILGNSDEVFQERHRELASIEERLQGFEREIARFKAQALEAEDAAASCREERSQREVDLRTGESRLARVTEEMEELEKERAGAEEARKRSENLVAETQGRLEEEQEQLRQARETVDTARQDFKERQIRIQELDRKIAQKSARLKLLQQLHERLEGYGEGAKALLRGKLGGPLAEQSFAPLASELSVADGYGEAIETLLGAATQAVAVADAATVTEILAQLEAGKVGRACLKAVSLGGPAERPEALPDFLRPAMDFVTLEENAERSALEGALGRCYVAEDFPAFLAWWEAHPEFRFLQVASKGGELADARGVVIGGYKKAQGNGILQREIELRKVGRELKEEQARLETMRREAEARNRELEAAEATVEETRRAIEETSRELSKLQAEARHAADRVEAQEARAERLRRERALLEEARARAAAQLKEAEEALAEKQARLEAARKRLSEKEEGVASVREERDRKREALSQAKFDYEQKKQQLDQLNQGLVEMDERRRELEQLVESKKRDIESWEAQIEEQRQAAAEAEQRGAALDGELETAKKSVDEARASLVATEEKIGRLESEQGELRAKLDEARASLGNRQVEIARKRSRREYLQEDVQREYGVDLRTVEWRFELWKAGQPAEDLPRFDLDGEAGGEKPDSAGEEASDNGASESGGANGEDPPAAVQTEADAGSEEEAGEGDGASESEVRPAEEPASRQPTEEELAALERTDWEKVGREIDSLRRRIQSLGAVNTDSIAEYGDLRERHQFLKSQCEDLTASRDKLVQAIEDINATSREQFSATFEQIRENFKSTFDTLFGGGKADLRLMEAEDPLESGIDIVAQPPGTRLKGVSLLSGGQRAMTAVGLLFAIYMVKPSPFCLLDELDAPLDESNIGRFTALLKRFAEQSQFIIITHNKRTISAAEAIYGVTMEEKGVSKVVSMKFHADRQHADLASLHLEEPVAPAAGA